MAEKQPFSLKLNFEDGEWLIPLALVTFASVFRDVFWTQACYSVAIFIVMFHILSEAKLIFLRKNLNKWRWYTLGAVVASFVVSIYVMVIYSFIAYAALLSFLMKRIKHKKAPPRALDFKRKIYQRMGLLFAAASFICFFKTAANLGVVVQYQEEQQLQNQRQQTEVVVKDNG